MFDRFTTEAKKVMETARREAQRLNHDYLSTEHILLGLIHQDKGVAAKVLVAKGLNLSGIRAEIERILRPGSMPVEKNQLTFTPRGKKVLELAMEEAGNLGHNYIGTEHLLLGLIKDGDGIAARVLKRPGLELDAVREEVIRVLSSEADEKGKPPKILNPERFLCRYVIFEMSDGSMTIQVGGVVTGHTFYPEIARKIYIHAIRGVVTPRAVGTLRKIHAVVAKLTLPHHVAI